MIWEQKYTCYELLEGNDYHPHALAPNSPSMPKRKDPSTVSRAASLSSQTLMIQLTDQQSVGGGVMYKLRLQNFKIFLPAAFLPALGAD